MDSLTLSFDTYVNADGTSITGESKTFPVLGVKGLDRPDDLQNWPAHDKTLLDGSRAQTNLKQRRKITVDFGVIETKADFVWLANTFALAPVKNVVCASPSETVGVVFDSPETPFSVDWIDGLEFAAAVTCVFVEKVVWADTPDAFA